MTRIDAEIEKLLSSEAMRARYEIGELLGGGAMGVVYRAVHRALDRPVALKVIRTGMLDEEGRQRFIREAQLAARVIHPNVVVVFDSGQEANVPYIAFELIDGPSLRQKLDQKPELEEIVRIGKETAAGLAAAHAGGIVHRDVKPENILLAGGTQVKISDFGVARPQREADGRLTSPGIILGSPAYMSPEQVASRPLTGATDQYSLGVVLFEMVTGNLPFEGSVGELMGHHLHSEPPLAPLKDELPPRLFDLLARLLAKDPAARFASMEEVAAAFGKAVLSVPTWKAGRSGRTASGRAVVPSAGRASGANLAAAGSGSVVRARATGGSAPREAPTITTPPLSGTATGGGRGTGKGTGTTSIAPEVPPTVVREPVRDSGPSRQAVIVAVIVIMAITGLAMRALRKSEPPVTPARSVGTERVLGAEDAEDAPKHPGTNDLDKMAVWHKANVEYYLKRYARGKVIGSVTNKKIYHVLGETDAWLPEWKNHFTFKDEQEAQLDGRRRAGHSKPR